jgi:Fe-S cluster assembly ATP-binding protein
MLKLTNVSATADNQQILNGINLTIRPNEIHILTGEKGSGKSMLAHAIAGHPDILISAGTITNNRKKLNNLGPDIRAKQGIFISFQYPPDYEYFTNWELFQSFFNYDYQEIKNLQNQYNECCKKLSLGDDFGELETTDSKMTQTFYKINELIYMLISNPNFIIIDEVDEELSDNELSSVSFALTDFLKNNNCGALIITRSPTLIEMINPTHIHIMSSGEIVSSGDFDFYKRIVKDGYSEFS